MKDYKLKSISDPHHLIKWENQAINNCFSKIQNYKHKLQIASSIMKLYTHLITAGPYKPIEYYSCSYLLDVQSDLLIDFSHPELLIICDHCQSLLSYRDISVLVEQPTDQGSPYSDLCVRCLFKLLNAKSVPKGRYFVRTANVFAIRTPQWRVADQVLLLKGIQTCGFGNWATISAWIQSHGSFVNKKRFEEHFYRYLWEKTRPVFDQEIRFIQSCSDESNRENSIRQENRIRQENTKQQNQTRSLIWSAQRNEFLVEYDWQAESIVADLEFRSDDSPEETEMKEALLIKYNEKLKGRMMKKKFAVDEGLLHHMEGSPVNLETENMPALNVESQKSFTEIKTDFSNKIFDSNSLTESFKSLESFIDSSKRYFVDDDELNQTKELALRYISSRTLLDTLKVITETTDKKKKCKKRKDVLQKISEQTKKI